MEEKTNEEVPQEGEFKMKKKPGRPKKLSNQKQETPKIEFKKQEDAVQTQETSNSDVVIEEEKNTTSSEKVVEEIRDAEKVESPKAEDKKEEVSVISEISELCELLNVSSVSV